MTRGAADDLSVSVAIVDSIAGLPYAIAYFGTSLLLYALALGAYVAVLPVPEFRLIGEGNTAAALSLAGAMTGLAMPLATVVATSASMFDLLVWSATALLVQLLTLTVLRRLLPRLNRGVVEGQVASGIFLGALGIAVGIINAASFLFI